MTNSKVTFSLTSKFDAEGFTPWNVSSTAAERYYGIRTGGLQYPLGTGPDMVAETFEPQLPLPIQSTYNAEVLGFTPQLDCEVLDILNSSIKMVFLPWYSIQAPFFIVNISTPGCNIENAIVAEGADHGIHNIPNATENFQGRLDNFTCSDGVDNSQPPLYRPDHTNTFPEHRILMSMANLRWDTPSEDIGQTVESDISTWWVQNLTAVLCRPSYAMNTYRIDYTTSRNASQDPVNAVFVQNSTQLPGFTDSDLTSAVVYAQSMMEIGSGGPDYVLANSVVNFYQVLAAANNDSRQESFMNASLLRDLGSEIWKGMATQVAHDNLMVNVKNSVLAGQVQHSESRLQVKILSMVFMAVLFGLLFCTSIVILTCRPHNLVPRDPGPIFATMALLATSPSLLESLSGLGSARRSKIRKSTNDYHYQSLLAGTKETAFSLDAVKGQQHVPAIKPAAEAEFAESRPLFSWWRPITSRRSWFCLAALLPLALIILLEILQRISDAHQGIISLDSSTRLNSRIVASYLPAFIMLVVASIYDGIESNVAISAPFAKLKRGRIPARSPYIMTDITNKLPPHALYLAVKALNMGHATCIVAVFVAAFLTIVVSGLYTTNEVPAHFTSSLRQSDVLNFGAGDFLVNDNGAAVVTSLLEYSDLPYPSWTYDGLVFDEFLPASNIGTSGSIAVQVPAYRAVLNCSVGYGYSAVYVGGTVDSSAEYVPGKELIDINAEVPLACQRAQSNYTSVTWTQTYYVPNDTSTVYVGKGTTFLWGIDGAPTLTGDGAQVSVDNGIDLTVIDLPTEEYGCPTFGFSIGTAAVKRKIFANGTELIEPEANMTLAMCYQNLEQVQTNLTLDLPNLSINSAVPPVTDESTAVLLADTSTGSQIWNWDINNFLATLTNTSSKSVILSPSGGSPALNDIDAFIQTLVQGKSPTPITSLLGDANVDALVTASEHLYAEYMAQAFSATVRIPANSTANNNITYSATVSDARRWRLQQNRTPKIALQVMLAFLAAAAIATYWLTDMQQILPHSPCSIAGVATLLADSELCTRDLIPVGAEWTSEKALHDAGVLGGFRLGMGWVEMGEKGRVFTIHAEGTSE